MNDIRHRVLRGGLAKLFAQAANLLLRLGSVMVLARFLDPKDFGLVAMVSAIAGIFRVFKDAGLASATIQSPDMGHEQFSSLFWINFIFGVFLAAILALVAPFIVEFYHEPRLFWITIVLALDFVFTGATAQPAAILQREMRFTTIAKIDICTLLVGISIALLLAVNGFGYWSLVGQAIAEPVIYLIGTWIVVGWKPSLPNPRTKIGQLLKFGGFVTLNNIVVYVAYNLEKVLLGRFWGADALGLYGRAYQLINIPTESINSSIYGVAFSALSRIQNEPARQIRYFLKGYALLLSVTIPITLICAIFSNEIVYTLLGPKWTEAAQIFRYLAPTIIIFALINPFGWLLYATGKAGRSLYMAFVIAPLTVGSYWIGLPCGPQGVALAYSTAMTMWVIPHIIWATHGLPIAKNEIAMVIGKPLISGLLAASITIALTPSQSELARFFDYCVMMLNLRHLISSDIYQFLRLVIGSLIMLINYAVILLFALRQISFFKEVASGLRN